MGKLPGVSSGYYISWAPRSSNSKQSMEPREATPRSKGEKECNLVDQVGTEGGEIEGGSEYKT